MPTLTTVATARVTETLLHYICTGDKRLLRNIRRLLGRTPTRIRNDRLTLLGTNVHFDEHNNLTVTPYHQILTATTFRTASTTYNHFMTDTLAAMENNTLDLTLPRTLLDIYKQDIFNWAKSKSARMANLRAEDMTTNRILPLNHAAGQLPATEFTKRVFVPNTCGVPKCHLHHCLKMAIDSYTVHHREGEAAAIERIQESIENIICRDRQFEYAFVPDGVGHPQTITAVALINKVGAADEDPVAITKNHLTTLGVTRLDMPSDNAVQALLDRLQRQETGVDETAAVAAALILNIPGISRKKSSNFLLLHRLSRIKLIQLGIARRMRGRGGKVVANI